MEIPSELIRTLRTSKHIAALTGAGISQESGLRTFRDAQTGLWAEYKPEDLATPEAFRKNPKLVWDWYSMRRARVAEVQPNPAHYALAEMARRATQFTLITQNVDGLHQRAAQTLKVSAPSTSLRGCFAKTFRVLPKIVELHGNLGRVRCFEGCGVVETWEETGEAVPRCPQCGGYLRPDVVWFGEPLPRSELEAAVEAARTCDVFFSIGTSGLVQPAAALAYAARNRGAVVVEINLEPTPLTVKADFAFHGRAGEILPALVQAVWNNPI
jgi:NAD-dependent deacetylase